MYELIGVPFLLCSIVTSFFSFWFINEQKFEVLKEYYNGRSHNWYSCSLCFYRYKQAVGVALETRRIDILQRAIQESVRGSQ